MPHDREPTSRDRTASWPQRWAPLTVGLLAAVVGVAVLVATASGIGISPDGVAYLSLAEQFRSEGSPYAVLAPSPTHYAPLWPVLVGGLAAITTIDDLLVVGRFLNAMIAAAIPVLAYLAIRRSPAVPAWWALLAAAMASLTFGLFRLSVRALTEPLFVALVLVALLLIERSVRHRSRPLLVAAAAVAAAAVATRFAGAALVVPLAVAAWGLSSSIGRRALDAAAVSVLAIAPTAVWVLAAPTTTASTHLDSGSLAGLGDLAQSIVEAGYVVVDPPSSSVADPLFFALGVVAIAAPIVAALVVARGGDRAAPQDVRTQFDRLGGAGLTPWLLFLLAYGALISLQRWWIGREVIDRYWVPWFVVATVLVARAVAEIGLLEQRRWRTVLVTGAATVALLNLALVAAFAVTRATDGIELNEARFRDAALFEELIAADVEVVVTDSVRLVELHVVTLGATDVEVLDARCRFTGESDAVSIAAGTTAPTAVLLADVCDTDAARAELSALAGSTVITEPGVGTLAVIDAG